MKAAKILKCADRIYALMFDMEIVSIHPDKRTTHGGISECYARQVCFEGVKVMHIHTFILCMCISLAKSATT